MGSDRAEQVTRAEAGVAPTAITPDPTSAVIAHALISSVAVVTNAIQSLLAYGDDLGDDERNRF